MSTTSRSSATARPYQPPTPTIDPPPKSRFPITPALLRGVFASARTANEERSISRVAFFRFAGFLLSIVGISLLAARGRGVKSGAALLGVM
ncbi:hypothetical protein HDZ31DRAFT_31806 [Schizophyllum fasciatum]